MARQAVPLGCAVVVLMFVLHPRVGIVDADGYAYLVGARSLARGHGYRSLSGTAFNHWPPGYSLLLSLFAGTLLSAQIVNYLSAGAATGLLYARLRRSGWTWQAALGLSTALASGFFRQMASVVHADVLTYAVFLAALVCAPWPRPRLVPLLLWAALIPVKLVAVAFVPAALVADWTRGGARAGVLARGYLVPAGAAGAALAGLLLFNHATIGRWLPASLEQPTLGTLLAGARSFALSIPRGLLFAWRGPLTAPLPLAATLVCVGLAVAALGSLRAGLERRWFLAYGLACLACWGLLLAIRAWDPSARLVGYGLLALLAGFRPSPRANGLWLTYGLASLIAGGVNAATVNSLGSADPRYAALAAEVRPFHREGTVVATNTFHILDLHADIPSEPVDDWAEARPYDALLWVTLPSYDPGATPVTIMGRPGAEWCEERRFEGAALFARCAGRGGG